MKCAEGYRPPSRRSLEVREEKAEYLEEIVEMCVL